MNRMESKALELRKVADHEWVIYDRAFPLDDSRSVVACVIDTEDDLVDVVWVQPTPLPTAYLSAADVLEDVTRHRGRASRSGRPAEIPHFPPLTGRSSLPRQSA